MQWIYLLLGVKTISELDCALEALNFKNLQRRARVLGRPFESWQLSKQVPTGRRIPPAWTCQPWNFTFSGIMEVWLSDNLKISVFPTFVQRLPWFADCNHSTNQFVLGSVSRTWSMGFYEVDFSSACLINLGSKGTNVTGRKDIKLPNSEPLSSSETTLTNCQWQLFVHLRIVSSRSPNSPSL